MRVLVVEDTGWQRERAHEALRQAGFEVSLAQSKEGGLRLGRQGSYDAAVVDLGLDDLPDEPTRGLELITELRRDKHNFPILVWSGFSHWEIRSKGKEAGADAYLVKSSDMEAFIPTLNAMIRRRKATNHPSGIQE